ncbi:HBS1L, partial [Symbiodinium microadriaticum]
FKQDALAEGKPDFTPDQWRSECLRTQNAIRDARTATRLLGNEWPFPPYRWPIELPVEDDDEPMSDQDVFGVQVEVTFYLLTPGYTPEKLELTAVLPQTVPDILELVDTCRDTSRKNLYPALVVVWPQPDPGWGLLLALPTWPRSQVAVCIDTSLFDGRVFATTAPREADFQTVCDLAGLGHHAEVDIYPSSSPYPLLPDEDCVLRDGMCLTFLRRGAVRYGPFSLPTMLESHLSWEHSPVLPRDNLGNGYCVAGPRGQILCRLHPERAFYYRSDIALLTDLHPFRTVVTPAAPQPTDVCVDGWECQTVVAATDRDDQVSWDGTVTPAIVGLFDCRPLLLGWLPISSKEAWIDLLPIKEALSRSAPPGWQVVFPGVPMHWTWICFATGQVIMAAMEPLVDANLAAVIARIPDSITRVEPPIAPDAEHVLSGASSETSLGQEDEARHGPVVNHYRHGDRRDTGPWSTALQICCLFGLLTVLPVEVISSGAVVFCALVAIGPPTARIVYLWSILFGGGQVPVTAMQRHPCCPGPSVGNGPTHETRPPFETAGVLWYIPTPCRAGWRPPGLPQEEDATAVFVTPHDPAFTAFDICGESLVTLLDEASFRDDKWAFLASTLLETLQEHFEEQQQSGVDEGTPLLLSHHLPQTQTHDLTDMSFDLGASFASASRLIQPGSWTLPHALPFGLAQDAGAAHLCTTPLAHISPEAELRIYTDGSFDGVCSSWSFAVVAYQEPGQHLLGWAANRTVTDPIDPAFVGADSHSPLIGEQCAILWAVAWALQAPYSHPIRFFSDCEVALRQTTGRYGTSSVGGLARTCRCLFQALEASRPSFRADITHVKSHTGHAANELVDRLAKQVCAPTWTAAPTAPFQCLVASWARSPHLTWLWTVYEAWRRPDLWPSFSGTGFADRDRFASDFRPTVRECRECFGLEDTQEQTKVLSTLVGCFCAFTLNAQTLAEGGDQPGVEPPPDKGFPGRVAFLREQFDYYGAAIVSIQEARAAHDGMHLSATHIRLCTGRDKHGNFGVELWFSRRHPFAWLGPTPICFEPSHLLALYSSPRELFVRYSRGGLRVLIVAIHGPSATCPHRDSWWRTLKGRVDQLCHGSSLLIIGDLNMHLSAPISGHVGDKVFPSKHTVPEAFVSLLQQYGLWIPSTFSHCHPGDHVTWYPPGGGPGARLDYILLPRDWHVAEDGSQVFTALEWGQTRVDHVALRTFVNFDCVGTMQGRVRRPAYDREAMLTEEGRAKLTDIFAAVPVQSWGTSVHEHYAAVQQHLVGALGLAFPTAKRSCRSSHFSAFTWQLRQRRVWLRRQVTRLRVVGQHVMQRCALLCLRRQLRLPVGCWVFALRSGRQLCALASFVADLRTTKGALRQAIKEDEDVAERIGDAAQSAHTTGTGNVVSRLQSLLGSSGRKTRPPKRLPGLTSADGSPALEPAEVEAAWVEHFSGIEAGQQCTPEGLVQDCLRTQTSRPLGDVCLAATDLPTRTDLEQAFRDTMLHRAFGADGIPAEALHAVPGAAAGALFPVIFKCAMRLAEPLHFKGGSLYAVWKGKASPSLCSSYRGILVSSTVGKDYLSVLHVTMAAQVVRLHQSWCKHRGISQALLFLDLREAFYRIVRPLVTGFTGTDEDVARIVSAVNLPPGVMHDLRAHLERRSLLAQSGATEWAAAATSEALHHTWFRFEYGQLVTETSVGTRPGDNLADLVFSFVFARVLKQVRQEAATAGSLTTLPWSPTMLCSVQVFSGDPEESLQILDCTWMDDSAFVLCHQDAGSLVDNLQHTSGHLLDSCLGRALLPNLDQGKTEAILSLQGKGSRKLRTDLFRPDPPVLEAPSDLWPGAHIRLVTQYRHLGGVLHHTGSLLREVKCRVALAWGAFNKRRKRIFASPVVARKDKTILFESLVLSVLLYGAGGWTEVGPAELAPLESAHHHMAATMLRPQYSIDAAKHLGPAQVLSLVELPSVPVLLHLARLRHLQSCVVVGVPEFWALAHAEASWLSLVRDSLKWLFELTSAGHSTTSWEALWPQWVDTMRYRPGAWKRLLRKAQTRAVRAERWQAALLNHRGLLSRQLQFAGGILICDLPAEWDRVQCCALCGKIFDSKQKWSVHAFKCHGRTTIGRGVKTAFSCVCAETARLRITAEVFLSGLGHMPDLSVPLRGMLREAMEWILCADIVAWLVPVPDVTVRPHNTFQEGDLVLHMLEVAHLAFPHPTLGEPSCIRCFVGPAPWCELMESLFPNSIVFTTEECVASISLGTCPAFLEGPYEDVAFYLCVDTWSGLFSPPSHEASKSSFQACLLRDTFLGDVVRLALRLWGLGVPASLLYPAGMESALAPLTEISVLNRGTVKSLQLRDAPTRLARAGDHLDVVALPVEQQFASIGGVISDPRTPVPVSDTLQVQLLVFDTEVPLMRGAQLMCYLHTETLTATLVRLEKLIVKGEAQERRPKCLVKGNNAIVWLQVSQKVCVEPKPPAPAVATPLSRFVLRDRGRTVGAGVVLSV